MAWIDRHHTAQDVTPATPPTINCATWLSFLLAGRLGPVRLPQHSREGKGSAPPPKDR